MIPEVKKASKAVEKSVDGVMEDIKGKIEAETESARRGIGDALDAGRDKLEEWKDTIDAARRSFFSKYKFWIIGGLCGLFVLGALVWALTY